MKIKYPRTLHVPWSPGKTSDDKVLKTMDHLYGKLGVITEKMDGECTSLYPTARHARSLDSTHHKSRDWLAAYHASIAYCIPHGYRICGEYLYAQHSIPYDDLPSYFLAFSMWNGSTCMGWDFTLEYLEKIGVQPVKELYRGILSPTVLREVESKLDLTKQEGYVVRLLDSFELDNFSTSVCKFVRAGHVQTDDHWMHKEIIPNKLRMKAA